MRKYLELTNQFSDLTTVKSFSSPYVSSTETKEVKYGVTCPNDVTAVITEYSETEWRVDGPSILKFLVPSYYLAYNSDELSFLILRFTPDIDDSSTAPIIYSQELSDKPVGSLSRIIINDKVEWDGCIQWSVHTKSPKLVQIEIEFFESGLFSVKRPTEVDLAIKECTPVMFGQYSIESGDRLLLLRNTLCSEGACYFIWKGTTPARLWIYYSSDLEASTPTSTNPRIHSYYDLEPESPLQLLDVLSSDEFFIRQAVVTSSSNGVLQVVSILPPPEGVTLLQHDVPVQLAANDSRVFCFPRTWTSTEFIAPTQFVMNMFVSNTSVFTPSVDDANVLNVYAFSNIEGVRVAQLSTADIANLVETVTDDYVYVRFTCNQATTLTPKVWTPTSCADKSILIQPKRRLTIKAYPNEMICRLRYDDWKDYDMTFRCGGVTVPLPIYFADTCEFALSFSNSHVIAYQNLRTNKSSTLTPETTQAWAGRVDEDGFIYVRFKHPTMQQGYVVFTSSKPAEVDPE